MTIIRFLIAASVLAVAVPAHAEGMSKDPMTKDGMSRNGMSHDGMQKNTMGGDDMKKPAEDGMAPKTGGTPEEGMKKGDTGK